MATKAGTLRVVRTSQQMPFWQHSGASYPDEEKTNMFSDKHTNFKGASSYLREQRGPSQPACLKKRWNLIQHLRSQFWKRWHLEYLNQLQQRTKWNKPRRNLKVNDMVLVKEDNLPPLQWSLGRVVQVFPGDDGAV
ncbi:DUF5641 domain-containing protein [Trichonephila clavipes]|nr:DUF5641 domain-containing protein [Trichonephila clavipes]